MRPTFVQNFGHLVACFGIENRILSFPLNAGKRGVNNIFSGRHLVWKVPWAPSTGVRSFGVVANFLHIVAIDPQCKDFVKIL